MSRKLESSVLGAWTFFAAAHAIDICGINGLPLTPNSIRILGHFQKLKTFIHDNISLYLDIKRGKHERIMIVSEYYSKCISDQRVKETLSNLKQLAKVIYQSFDALAYLHSQGIVHRCLSPKSLLMDSQNNIKLSNYGLYYITEGGASVSFPIGVPKYMAPEILICSPSQNVLSGPKCDVWSLGMILLELVLDIVLWDGFSLEDTFQEIMLLMKLDSGQDVLNSIVRDHDAIPKLQNLPCHLKSLIEECLTVLPENRPSSEALLNHSLFQEYQLYEVVRYSKENSFLTTELRCRSASVSPYCVITDHLAHRPLAEIYYLWQLTGGDVEAELRRQELIKAKPSVLTISNLVVEEGEEFGYKKDRAFLLDNSVLELHLDSLRQRLQNVDPAIYYPLIEHGCNGSSSSSSSIGIQETAKLPLVIKEKDIEYQLHRIILLHRLLEAYPYKKLQIFREAKVDIPPIYRAHIWASLLEIEGDIQSWYDSIDKETPTATDRQIEVDIPRCHQYDELLSSPSGHQKFKRLLKAWVVSHPQYVYWQGLDSLCAPFLYLNFNDEALAYACFSAFIPKYLHNFFLKDNSPVIQEYLGKFSHLIAYHDPELTNHLDEIGFIPELYAIPWFLTMYTHVFPLHKIFHLWDTLLLGNSSVPLCIGFAILKQLRNNLLSSGFNECILMFSDMPDIDMQQCVQDCIKIFCSTPKSITYREHENKALKSSDRLCKISEEKITKSELEMSPVPLHVLKSEPCPRISAEDLLDLLNLLPGSRQRGRSIDIKILVLDVRSYDEFTRGSLLGSVNIPFSSAFTPEEIVQSEMIKIRNYKGKMITVMGSCKNNHASEFATKLLRLGYSKVSTLHGGVEVLRGTGFLTISVNSG